MAEAATAEKRGLRKRPGSGARRIGRYALLAPSAAWLLLFVLAPVSILFLYSFWTSHNYQIVQEFTLANYRATFTDPVFRTVMWRTLRLAFLVTATSLLLGYPVAYFIARKVTRWKTFFYLLVIIPMWSSYLVRVYSWKSVLGDQGVLNLLLMKLGILQEPSPIFLYNVFAVYLALVGSILPFMILPIYTSLEKIPQSLVEASSDLGAGFWRTFVRVILAATGGSNRSRAAASSCSVCSDTCWPSRAPVRLTPKSTWPPAPFRKAQIVSRPSRTFPVVRLNSSVGPSPCATSWPSAASVIGMLLA